MRRSLITLAALAALAGPALAQTTVTGQPAQPGNNSANQPGQSAVSRPNTDAGQPGATGSINLNAKLEPGASSFTEGQVRSRMEQAGLQQVQNLKKNDNGIWQGQAMHNGRTVMVGMDFKGNVGLMQP
jgi:putative membrane protein